VQPQDTSEGPLPSTIVGCIAFRLPSWNWALARTLLPVPLRDGGRHIADQRPSRGQPCMPRQLLYVAQAAAAPSSGIGVSFFNDRFVRTSLYNITRNLRYAPYPTKPHAVNVSQIRSRE
jgi:hypothetical protein